MKKRIILIGLLFITAFSSNKQIMYAIDETSTEIDNEVSRLFQEFYNDGNYKKQTTINLNENTVAESVAFFHAQSTILERTTYYSGDALWMSRNNGKYSYYGTVYKDGTPIGVTNATASETLIHPENAVTVLSGEGKNSMEEYYVTLHDFKNRTYKNDWKFEDNKFVYVPKVQSNSDEIFTYFRNFTAPCFLEPTESNINYLTFTKASVEVEGHSLILKLYVSEVDVSKLVPEHQEDLVFSQAIITYDEFADVWDGSVASSYSSGTGTKEDPYIISKASELAYLSQQCRREETDSVVATGEYYRLANNINLNNIAWTPIASVSFKDQEYCYFDGTFDGAGYTISGLNIDNSKAAVVGLFGCISGTVENVVIAGNLNAAFKVAGLCYWNKGKVSNIVSYVDVVAGAGSTYGNYSAGICAATTDGIMNNCVNYGDVEHTSTKASKDVGGITGLVTETNTQNLHGLFNCYNFGNITLNGATCTSVGGIVGEGSVKVENCYNFGQVYGEYYYAGGIVGNATAEVVSCKNYGYVVTNNRYAGGIIGYANGATISNSENNGVIEGKGTPGSSQHHIGGVVGRIDNGIIENSVNNGVVIATCKYIGGIAGTSKASTLTKCFNYGNISSNITHVGGIVGYLQSSGTIKECQNYGTIASVSGTIGGIVGSSDGGTIKECTNNGIVTCPVNKNVSQIIGNNSKSAAKLENNIENGIVEIG